MNALIELGRILNSAKPFPAFWAHSKCILYFISNFVLKISEKILIEHKHTHIKNLYYKLVKCAVLSSVLLNTLPAVIIVKL